MPANRDNQDACKRIDHLELAKELKSAGALLEAGGPSYIMGLDAGPPFAHSALEYAREILNGTHEG